MLFLLGFKNLISKMLHEGVLDRNQAMMSNYFDFCNEQFDPISEGTTNKQQILPSLCSGSCLCCYFPGAFKK